MLTFRDTWEWDLAAGALIGAEAGATVSDRSGGDAAFNQPHPAVDGALVAAPAVHAAVLARRARDSRLSGCSGGPRRAAVQR